MKSWAFWPKSFSRAAKTRFCGSSWTIWEIFQNNLHFTSFSVFQSTFSGLLAQFFWQVCQKWILSLRRIVRRPLKKLSAALSKLCSTCRVEHLAWQVFFKEFHFHNILDCELFVFDIPSKNSSSNFETSSYVSSKNTLRKRKCSEISELFDHRRTRRTRSWAFWWTFFQQGCQNCFLRLKLNKLGIFFSKICCNFS